METESLRIYCASTQGGGYLCPRGRPRASGGEEEERSMRKGGWKGSFRQ